MKLEDELNCEGYYGFGGGYLWAKKHGGHPPGEDRALYCSDLCSRREVCWYRHRGRVVFLFPAVTASFMELHYDPDNPLKGPELIKEWMKRYQTDQPDPFTHVMTGNLEDGMAVGFGGRPKDRAPFTLPWPLERRLP